MCDHCARVSFVLVRLQVNTLNGLETKKKFQLVERVLCALYAYLGFFHQVSQRALAPNSAGSRLSSRFGIPKLRLPPFHAQGHSELANLEPSMRDLQHQLRLARREFAKQSRIADAKRMQLEVSALRSPYQLLRSADLV